MTTINYELLGQKHTGGGVDDNNNRYLEFDEYYRLENAKNFPEFLAFMYPVGRLVHKIPPFRVKTTSVKRISEPLPDGSVTLTVHLTCEARYDIETDIYNNPVTENTPPWFLRPQDFRIASATQEESVKFIWPGLFGRTPFGGIRSAFGSPDVPVPFLNSAGENLEGTVSRGLAQMSFAYNLPTIDPNAVWKYCFKTNKTPVIICGMEFPERTALIQSIAMEPKTDYNADSSVRWKYYKVAVQFLLDPESFNKDYHNLGTRVKTIDGIAKIWTWDNGTQYGTLDRYQDSDYADGEEITSPLYLNTNGTNVNSFDSNGSQIPVYINGSVFEPIDFNFLDLPRVR